MFCVMSFLFFYFLFVNDHSCFFFFVFLRFFFIHVFFLFYACAHVCRAGMLPVFVRCLLTLVVNALLAPPPPSPSRPCLNASFVLLPLARVRIAIFTPSVTAL